MQSQQSQQSQQISGKPFSFELTSDQSFFLQTKIPRLFSFQEIKKAIKKSKKDVENKQLEQGLSGTNLLSRSSRHLDLSIIDGSQTKQKQKRNRSKKLDDYVEEDLHKKKVKQPSIKTINSGQGCLSEQEALICSSIISQLKRNHNCKPFLRPVDPIELNIPDYFNIITNPMDISTIQRKLRNHVYFSFKQFRDDLTLIWMNSYKFNQKGSDIYLMTAEMDKLSTKLIQKRSFDQSQNTYQNARNHLNSKKEIGSPKSIKKSKSSNFPKINQLRTMTTIEKRKLCESVKKLSKQHLQGVWKIVSQNNDSHDLIFDVEKLPISQLWQLDAYIKNIKQIKQQIVENKTTNIQKSEESSSFMVDSDSDKLF